MTSTTDRRDALLGRLPDWTPMTLDGFLAQCAAEYADRPFVITDERVLTYAEADHWATELAAGLIALGVAPGDPVGLLMANHVEFVPLKFAIARAGGIAIPFNFLYREQELAFVLRQSGCKVLVTMDAQGALDQLAMLDRIAPAWADGATSELPDLEAVVALPVDGDAAARNVLTVERLGELGDAAAVGAPRRPEDVADILYTSGTTGAPKGVMVSHDAVLRTGFASALTRAFGDRRRVLFSLPCYHMFGYVEGVVAAMYVGGAIIPRVAFSAGDYLASIERHRATEILCVPTMTVALLEHPDRYSRDLSSLTALLSGAAPAPAWLWERVRSELGVTELTTGYGMTECGGAMTMTLPEDPIARHAGTVGKAKLAGPAGIENGDVCEYRTADPLTGEVLEPGEEGELISRGPTHMLGFWRAPELTAEALRGGWLHSGDLGRVAPDGYLQLTGRNKELYKSGGELVMPKEIEELLTREAGVSQAFAVAVPDDRWGEVGCAWVVAEPDVELDPAALLAVCRAQLARFKVPKYLFVLTAEELPTTPTGKVQKFRLAARAAERVAAISLNTNTNTTEVGHG